jgi:16S rRNA (guanine966-N2)-methyltransferase
MTRIIAGFFRGRVLKTPKGDITRPTSEKVRGALFNAIGPSIEGSRFLDLCAGSGAVGLEAMSRGALEVIFVEKHPIALKTLKENVQSLEAAASEIYGTDIFSAIKILEQKGKKFDFIFIDPPYEHSKKRGPIGKALVVRLVETLDTSPLLNKGGRLIIEEGGHPAWPIPCKNIQFLRERAYGETFLFEFISSLPDLG